MTSRKFTGELGKFVLAERSRGDGLSWSKNFKPCCVSKARLENFAKPRHSVKVIWFEVIRTYQILKKVRIN